MTDTDVATISLRGVSKHYGALRAVDGVDLSVRPGELFGLIGHNGAGKSTLFKMMLGLVPPTAGAIRIAGADVCQPGFRAVRRHVGYLPEHLALYDNLTGLETLRFFARLKSAPAAQCPALLDQVGLSDAAGRPVREYSKGMRQRLGFAQTLLGAPRVLFLDEPTNGLDPSAIRDFHDTLQSLRGKGVTVVITSHILAELQQRVDRLAVMAHGKVRLCGSVAALRDTLGLPLEIRLRAGAGYAAVAAALDGTGATVWRSEVPGEYLVQCPRPAKMAALAALHAGALAPQDLEIHEPSLEDLYFGLEDAA